MSDFGWGLVLLGAYVLLVILARWIYIARTNVVWTSAQARGFALGDVVRWKAERPARLASLNRKGRIAVGFDADLSVFAPDEEFTVDPGQLHHRHPLTPYAGRRLKGVVRRTLLRGEWIDYERPMGSLLRRTVA